ncbi:SPOR domain-containing protein [Alteromonas ponticola]|uniref:SPOR domain-containing protein n=1 Tax=Alteromonas aquimaris TaxID=2998417 RepID=A0ABT3P6E9_9ALTE|nr:SPOR domain-containing protein [Alteromonas aquimaris]MCW8108304.1 SPOR domain-containing protein [Alteromonas aquimaris]
MASALQNRLIGTVIVVALAVIFLPDFLDGKKERKSETFAEIPAPPARKPIVNPEPFPTERVEKAVQRPIEIVSEEAVDDIAVHSQQVKEQTVESVDEDDLAKQTVVEQPEAHDDGAGWVIQLGSFRHQKNVRQLLTKLEKAGYRAFSRPIQTSSGPLTKVFVGPDLQKAKLENAIPHLQELTGLKGKVTTFKVD